MTTAGMKPGNEPETGISSKRISSETDGTSDFKSARNKRLGRENAAEKALRLLVEGRLRVTFVHGDVIFAQCRGDSGEVYAVGHDPAGAPRWRCTCPARSACSHLRALWLVTAIEAVR